VGAPDREYSEAPRPGVVRVALFGDSFTNGVDERFEDTWAAGLHERLAAGEHRYEIINFGVPGYGMDQALLRWRTVGRRFAPHVVVFGLQIENVRRNTNVIRPLYNPVVDIPFSKPRFILEGDHLEVINQPTVPPEALAATIARIDEWEWVRYEDYYDPADYRTPPWLASRFLGVLTSIIRTPADEGVATPEQRVLALRLLEEFEGEARPSGATFIVVHLPRHADLQALAASGRLPAAS